MVLTKPVAIIGAGPAGMAVTLQLQRFGIGVLLFEQNPQNSLLKNAWCVENYLGCYPGKTGIKLLHDFQTHLTKNKINTIKTEVQSLGYDTQKQLFKIKTAKTTYTANYVIVASGTKPKLLPQNLGVTTSKRVFYNVFPLLKKRNETILIIGAGDVAFDNALNLAKYNRVIICNRAKTIQALPLLVNKAIKNPRISYFHDYKLHNITTTSWQKKMLVIFTNRRKKAYIEADYLLVAIGRLPQKNFYTGKLQALEKRLIKKHKLFLVGDVKNNLYRQVAIAVGDGIKTAMYIFHNLA